MDTKERTIDFLNELRLPKSRFAADVGLSDVAIKKWLRGDLKLASETIDRIDGFLKSFNR